MSWERRVGIPDDGLGLMERLSIAFVGGMAIPAILFFALFIAAQTLSPEWEVYLEALSWLISWPEWLLPHATFSNIGGVLLALLFSNFMAYSLLTYVVLRLWERRQQPRLP
jgi:hypothetical protein